MFPDVGGQNPCFVKSNSLLFLRKNFVKVAEFRRGVRKWGCRNTQNSLLIPVFCCMAFAVESSYTASILAYMPVQIKSPRFCGIFHALTLVWAKNAPFYAIISCFLYPPHFPIVNTLRNSPKILYKHRNKIIKHRRKNWIL